jgi:transposase
MTSAPQQLPQTLEAAHAVIATLSEKLSQTLRENELLKQKIDKLCRRLFGKSSEKVSPEQLALAFAQLPQDGAAGTDSPAESAEWAEDTGGETTRPRPTGRKAFPKHLPRQRVLVMPADEELTCACGQRKTQIAEKVTERLDYVPASAIVVETVRPVFVCERCHDGVTVAPAPTQAVDATSSSPSTWTTCRSTASSASSPAWECICRGARCAGSWHWPKRRSHRSAKKS